MIGDKHTVFCCITRDKSKFFVEIPRTTSGKKSGKESIYIFYFLPFNMSKTSEGENIVSPIRVMHVRAEVSQ